MRKEDDYSGRFNKLADKYEGVLNLLQKLPKGRLQEIETVVPCVLGNVGIRKEKLRSHEFTLLISGNTNEGTCQLVNSLCQQDLLAPNAVRPNVCYRLRYTAKSHGVVHTEKDAKPKLVTPPGDRQLMSQVMHDVMSSNKKDNNICVDFGFPIRNLKDGMTLLVVPPSVTKMAMLWCLGTCIPPATGIVYAVDAGKDFRLHEVRDLMTRVSSALQEDGQRKSLVDSQSLAFFCFNETEGDDVTDKIMKISKNITEDHIVRVPGSQEKVFSTITADPSSVIACTAWRNLITNTQHGTLENSFRYISKVLKRAYLTIKGNLGNLIDTSYANRDIYDSIYATLTRCESKQEKILREVSDLKEKEVSTAISNVTSFLESPMTKAKLVTWKEQECPDVKGDWDAICATMLAAALIRIRDAINRWDCRRNVFEGMQKRLLDFFRMKFADLEGQLAAIEASIMNGDVSSCPDKRASNSDESEYVNLGFSFKFQIALAAVSAQPIGDMLDHVSLLKLQERIPSKNPKHFLMHYKLNRMEEMRRVTEAVLNGLTGDIGIRPILKDKLDKFVDILNGLVNSVPQLIAADKDMLENIMTGVEQSDEKVHQIYWDLYTKAHDLKGKLDFLYLSELRTYDVLPDEIYQWGELIAEGTYGKIQMAHFRRDTVQKVACKMLKGELNCQNATEFLAEEESLRRLQRPHVVRFFGTLGIPCEGTVQPVMVMEYCHTTLDTVIFGSHLDNPGKFPPLYPERQEAERTMANWAFQICSGLMSIHQLGYMHRDLKPKNILIDEFNEIKLADLGLTKPECDVRNTYCGTPSYMAPEVLRGRPYTKAADIYSFAMILCEMWTGNYVDYLYRVPMAQLEREIKERSARPKLSPNSPTGQWKDLIETCWSDNPAERYSANYCCKIFSKLRSER